MLIKFDKGECITSRGPNLDFHNFPKLIKRIHHVVIIGSVVEPADPNATRFIESNSNSYAYQTGVILFIVLCDSTGSPFKSKETTLSVREKPLYNTNKKSYMFYFPCYLSLVKSTRKETCRGTFLNCVRSVKLDIF